MWDGSIRILEGLLTAILSDRMYLDEPQYFGNPWLCACIFRNFPYMALQIWEVSRVLTGAGSSEQTPMHTMITFRLPSASGHPVDLLDCDVCKEPSAICGRLSG